MTWWMGKSEMEPLKYTVAWCASPERPGELENVLLTLVLPVYPAVRQTRGTRWRTGPDGKPTRSALAAMVYNESQGTLKDALTGIMLAERMPPFSFEQPPLLGLSLAVWESDQRRLKVADLDNYLKAVKDAANEILWKDDRFVRRYGEVSLETAAEPSFRLSVWCLRQDLK